MGLVLTRGQVSKPSSSSTSRRPPDYVYHEQRYGSQPYSVDPWLRSRYRRWNALEDAYMRHNSMPRKEKEKTEGILGRVASVLDKPYMWVSKKGSELVSWLAGKSMEEKSKGEHVEGLLYAIGASAASFLVGVGAGLAGLISPRAWKETAYAATHPRETLEAIKDNPLAVSYLLGSIVGPARIFKAAGARLARVREPDLTVTDRGSLTIHAVKTRSGEIKWAARLEAEGPARPVGRTSAASNTPPERVIEVETPRARVRVLEVRKGNVVRRAFRVEYAGGKRIVGLDEWRFKGWLRPKYEYKGLIVDPVKAETLVAERPRPLVALREVYALAPPRVVVAPRLWSLGLLGLAGGLAMVSGFHRVSSPGAVREQSLGVLHNISLTTLPRATIGGSVITGSQEALAGRSLDTSILAAPLSSRGRTGLLLPVNPVAPPLWAKKQRRRAYSEIVYPEAILPL